MDEIEALLNAAAMPDEVLLNLEDKSNASFLAAIQEYRRLRDVKDKLNDAKKTNEEALENLTAALVSVFESKGIKSLRVEGIGLISTAANNNPKVVSKELLFAWLESQGEEGLIKKDVNYMTLKSFLNQRVEDGKTIPPATICELTAGRTLKLSREK